MHNPIRVLAVTNLWPSAGYGVRGIFVQEQVESLRSLGVHVDVEVVAQHRGKSDYLRAAYRVPRRARTGAYDLIHVHYGLTAASVTFTGATPKVLSLYGSDVNVPWQRAIASRLRERFAARIYVSQRLADTAGDKEGHVIPAGVDLDLFAPGDRDLARAGLGIDAGEQVVLFGGAPANQVKGYDVFSDVLAALRGRGVPVRELILTGSSPTRDIVPTRFAAADLLLFTSRQGAEGSPGVVKEAVAMGLPVVSVDVGDVAQTLSGVRPSSVVPFPSTRGELIEALAAQAAEVLATRRRSNGRALADRFSWAASTEKLVAVYHKVLSR